MELLRRHGDGNMRWEETLYLKCLLTELLHSLKELWVLSQNICVHLQNYCVSQRKHCDLLQHICVCSQNYWVTPRNFMISFAKHLCLLTHLLHFPEKRWGSLTKKLKYSFILCQSQRFCEGAQSFSGKCKSFVKEHIEIFLFLPLNFFHHHMPLGALLPIRLEYTKLRRSSNGQQMCRLHGYMTVGHA